MASNDSIKKTLTVAIVLCIVCSILVSTATVMLRPMQKANKELDFKRNILAAAHLLEEGKSVDELFSKIETRIVDLRTGKFSDEVPVATYDQKKASKDPSRSQALSPEVDVAGLSRREHFAKVYLVNDENGLQKIVLPIRGYGLWSTLWGFIALESDLNTVVGLGYYEHAETPGLGGEVDNPKWKNIWPGKQVYDASGNVKLSVVKGVVSSETPEAKFKVDGLSGATLTSDGVTNMIHFWLSENGYATFLTNLQNGEA